MFSVLKQNESPEHVGPVGPDDVESLEEEELDEDEEEDEDEWEDDDADVNDSKN